MDTPRAAKTRPGRSATNICTENSFAELGLTRTNSTADSLQSDNDHSDLADDEGPSSPPRGDMPGGKMPAGNRRPVTPKREIDLSFLLNMTQKADLLALAAKIWEQMEAKLDETHANLDNYAARKPARVTIWTYKVQKTVMPINVEQIINGEQATTQNVVSNIEVSKPRKTIPGMTELHREVVANFKKWQYGLSRRLGEISVIASAAPRRGQPPAATRVGMPPASPMQQAPARDDYPRDDALIKRFPPIQTPLLSMPVDKRRLLLHTMVLILLSLEHYSSHSRSFLLSMASALHIPTHILVADEQRIAKILYKIYKTLPEPEPIEEKKDEKPAEQAKLVDTIPSGAPSEPKTQQSDAGSELKADHKPETKAPTRKPKVQQVFVRFVGDLVAAGLGSVTNGTRLGISVVAALLGPISDCHSALGAVFSVYFNRPVGKCLEAFSVPGSDVALLPVHDVEHQPYLKAQEYPPEARSMRLVIGINGMQDSDINVTGPWKVLGTQNEVFAMRWEAEALAKLTTAFDTLVNSAAWSQSKKELASRPTSKTLEDDVWPANVLKVSKIIDNHWCAIFAKADKAGVALADAILNKVQGERGVSLMGFGLGARVVYTCLASLSERRGYGLVDSALLMGAPCPSDAATWASLRGAVGGRLVNVYSEADHTLGFAHRIGCWQFGVAGLQSIDGVGGIENLDLTNTISSYAQYIEKVPAVLEQLGWEDLPMRTPASAKQPQQGPTVQFEQASVPVLGSKENRQDTRAPSKPAQKHNGKALGIATNRPQRVK